MELTATCCMGHVTAASDLDHDNNFIYFLLYIICTFIYSNNIINTFFCVLFIFFTNLLSLLSLINSAFGFIHDACMLQHVLCVVLLMLHDKYSLYYGNQTEKLKLKDKM